MRLLCCFEGREEVIGYNGFSVLDINYGLKLDSLKMLEASRKQEVRLKLWSENILMMFSYKTNTQHKLHLLNELK